MKYWERCALYCCILVALIYLAIQLGYICYKIYQGWTGGAK